MKQKLLSSIFICAVLMGNVCMGQVTQSPSGNNFTITPPAFANSIISHTAPLAGNNSASASVAAGSRIVWLEYGDGGFISDASSSRTLANVPLQNPFLIATKLYDTTRDNMRISSQSAFSPNGNRTGNKDNNTSLLSANTNVIITPNTYDIIQRDTMGFAITYRISPTAIVPHRAFYMVFRYNTNTFRSISIASNSGGIIIPSLLAINSSTYSIPPVRTYHGETLITPPSGLLNQLPVIANANSAMPVIARINLAQINNENNLFVYLVTKDTLVQNNTTSVDASLIQFDSSSLEYSPVLSSTYNISGMMVSTSHDPNYITQSPLCMQLPKIVRDMKYHIHFQNTGRGPADTVRVTANLPMGLNLSTCQLNSVVFSGSNYAISTNANNNDHQLDTTLDQAGNKIIFKLYQTSVNNTLQGTNNVFSPAINPETMGDIYFTITATTNVPYTLIAQAFIDFHSKSRPPNRWENTVATNIAVSNYSECCNCKMFDCDRNSNDSTGKKSLIRK